MGTSSAFTSLPTSLPSPEEPNPLSLEARLTLVVLNIPAVAVGLIGNMLVIVAFFSSSSLRTVSSSFVVGLAVADLDIGVFVGLPFVVGLLNGRPWTDTAWCKASANISVVSIMASILNYLLICVHRFVRLMLSNQTYMRLFGLKWKVCLWFLSPWILSLATIVHSTSSFLTEVFACVASMSCHLLLVVVYLVVCVVIFVLYVLTYRRIVIIQQKVSSCTTAVKKRAMQNKTRVLKLSIFLSCLNIYLMAPYLLLLLLFHFPQSVKRDPVVLPISQWLLLCSSALNGIIFGGLNTHFRKYLSSCCRRKRAGEEEEVEGGAGGTEANLSGSLVSVRLSAMKLPWHKRSPGALRLLSTLTKTVSPARFRSNSLSRFSQHPQYGPAPLTTSEISELALSQDSLFENETELPEVVYPWRASTTPDRGELSFQTLHSLTTEDSSYLPAHLWETSSVVDGGHRATTHFGHLLLDDSRSVTDASLLHHPTGYPSRRQWLMTSVMSTVAEDSSASLLDFRHSVDSQMPRPELYMSIPEMVKDESTSEVANCAKKADSFGKEKDSCAKEEVCSAKKVGNAAKKETSDGTAVDGYAKEVDSCAKEVHVFAKEEDGYAKEVESCAKERASPAKLSVDSHTTNPDSYISVHEIVTGGNICNALPTVEVGNSAKGGGNITGESSPACWKDNSSKDASPAKVSADREVTSAKERVRGEKEGVKSGSPAKEDILAQEGSSPAETGS